MRQTWRENLFFFFLFSSLDSRMATMTYASYLHPCSEAAEEDRRDEVNDDEYEDGPEVAPRLHPHLLHKSFSAVHQP